MSNLSDLKGEITIMNMDAEVPASDPENEGVSIDITDKVYYLPESAIGKLPFLVHTGYMQDDLADPGYWKQLEENIDRYELVWSREG